MLRSTLTSRSSLSLAAFSLVAMAACSTEKDENGGRPVESKVEATTTTPVAVTKPDKPDTKVRVREVATTTPTDVSFKDADGAFKGKRYAESAKMFSDYTISHPGNAYSHYMLGLSSWKSGDLTVAQSAFEKALTLDPKNVKTLLNLSRVLLDAEKPKEARQYVTQALKVDSTSNEVHRLMGRVHSTLKENDEAIVSFRLALKYNPSDVWSMNNMALILIQQRRYDEALGPLARAVKLDSNVAVFQNNLGIVLEHVGQYGLASVAYHNALAADSSYTKAVMSLSRIKGLKDDPSAAPVDLAKVGDKFDGEVRTMPVSVAVTKK